ncbi:hypothetical protein NGA_0483400, partial [Nannochloropsis gaditana CCMP526]|uniref:uncharacterized protein n=1 Tax=Nannochloropsis gaditana (strain CCMP526) TaxID=1093141 RepID=UPI00029F7AB9
MSMPDWSGARDPKQPQPVCSTLTNATLSSPSSLFWTGTLARSQTRLFRQAVQEEMRRLQHHDGLPRAAAVEKLLARLTSPDAPSNAVSTSSYHKTKPVLTSELHAVMECYGLTPEEARRALLVKSALGQLRRQGWDASTALMELTARMVPLRLSSPSSPAVEPGWVREVVGEATSGRRGGEGGGGKQIVEEMNGGGASERKGMTHMGRTATTQTE